MDRHALLCAISDARNGCISHPKSRNGLISACMTSAFLPRIKARQGYCKALLKADSTKLRRRICHSASNDQLKVIPRRHVLCESMTRIDIQRALLSYGGRSEKGKLMDKSTSTSMGRLKHELQLETGASKHECKRENKHEHECLLRYEQQEQQEQESE